MTLRDRVRHAIDAHIAVRLAPPRVAHAAALDEEFAGYPENQVFGILDARDQAAAALDDAREAGIPMSQVTVYSGEEGAEAIDSRGVEHGLTGVIQRSIQFLVADRDDLRSYEEAVDGGKVVLAIEASDDDRKRQAAAILQRHGGHDVRHFGALTVQRLDVDPSRTRAGQPRGAR